MNSKLYPTSPVLGNYDFIKPSATFRKTATSVILAIFLFFLVYLLLVIIAGVILYASGWAGLEIISINPSFLTLVVGGGLILLGIMFFAFLFKFIFSNTKYENPYRIEIKEKDEPELFAFIKALNKDTKTKPPKKIFLSPEVNAMVFYNSNFWSLFLPVRKNLEIGLGLVNSLTVSEFKAVLAHEFGHFSQRSMKIGSYIYTVNRVIYNLVFEYDKWDEALSTWAQAGGIFGLFAGITFWLVERIRSLLKLAYNLINVSYMKLSRAMEFHADLVAVSVSGTRPLKNALRKIEFTSLSYDNTTEYLNSLTAKHKATNDIYENHHYLTAVTANLNQLEFQNGFLEISDQYMEQNVVKSRVIIKDQWASHPTLKEREVNIDQVNIEVVENNKSAWEIFAQPEKLRKKVTELLYQVGFPGTDFENLNQKEFSEFVESEINRYKISDEYNGYFDIRQLPNLDISSLHDKTTSKKFEEIYSRENIDRIKWLELNKIDLEILKQISLKQIQTKFFEFDGQKYKRKEASKILRALKLEIETAEKEIIEIDKEAYIYNRGMAKKTNSETQLDDYYLKHFELTDLLSSMEEHSLRFQKVINRLQTQVRWTEPEIMQLSGELWSMEKQFKDFLKERQVDKFLENIESENTRKELEGYITSTRFYSRSAGMTDHELESISMALQEISISIGTRFGNNLKALSEFQLENRRKAILGEKL